MSGRTESNVRVVLHESTTLTTSPHCDDTAAAAADETVMSQHQRYIQPGDYVVAQVSLSLSLSLSLCVSVYLSVCLSVIIITLWLCSPTLTVKTVTSVLVRIICSDA